MIVWMLQLFFHKIVTNKVDRSVSGLIAQQQCVGPFQTPISNYSLTNLGYFDNKGIASSVGERPIYGLFNNKAQADSSRYGIWDSTKDTLQTLLKNNTFLTHTLRNSPYKAIVKAKKKFLLTTSDTVLNIHHKIENKKRSKKKRHTTELNFEDII